MMQVAIFLISLLIVRKQVIQEYSTRSRQLRMQPAIVITMGVATGEDGGDVSPTV